MQRRYRVFTDKRRRRGLLWIPPSVPTSTTGPVPALIHRHRKARLPVHRRHGHLYRLPPVPAAPAVVIAVGEPYFRWATGTSYLS